MKNTVVCVVLGVGLFDYSSIIKKCSTAKQGFIFHRHSIGLTRYRHVLPGGGGRSNRRFSSVLFPLLLLFSFSLNAEGLLHFSIPKSQADRGLRLYAEQAGRQILFPFELMQRYSTNEVVGRYPADEALQILLRDTDLVAEPSHSGVLIVSVSQIQRDDKELNEQNGEESKGLIEEIYVTAQKRKQNMQDVGISLTVFDSESIAKRGFQNYSDIVTHSPNFTMQNIGPAPMFRIRGQGTHDASTTIESPVAFYVDEVYRANAAGRRLQMFDLDRVEVLRGPQGTLFGRNTTAGVVHIVSRKPAEDFDGYVRAQIGSFGQNILEGGVGGTISDTVRGRIAVKHNSDDGWQENKVNGDQFAVTDVIAIRTQIEFDLGDFVKMLLKVSYQDDDSTAFLYGHQGALAPESLAVGDIVGCSAARIHANECVSITNFRVPDLDPTESYTEEPTSNMMNYVDLKEMSARISWDISDSLELISLTAYMQTDRENGEDVDASATGGVLGNTTIWHILEQTEFSQEFRLNGHSDQLNWVAGLYYFESDGDAESFVHQLFGLLPESEVAVATQSWALFGELEYRLSEKLSVIGGLRFTDDEKSSAVNTLGLTADYDISDSEVTGKLGVNWQPADDLLVYGSVSTGFRSGDFVTQLFFGEPATGEPADSETVTAYEVGLKSTLWNQRAQFNVALFFTDVEDKQATVITEKGGLPSTDYSNFGDVEIYGLEAELNVYLMENLKIELSLGLMETEVSAPSDSFYRRGPRAEEFPADGNELPASPSVNYSALVRYTFPSRAMGAFSVQADYSWQEDVYLTLGNDPYDVEDAYGLLALRAFWESPNGRYSAQMFVENATDEEYSTHTMAIAGFDQRLLSWGRPRWAGASFSINF